MTLLMFALHSRRSNSPERRVVRWAAGEGGMGWVSRLRGWAGEANIQRLMDWVALGAAVVALAREIRDLFFRREEEK